MGITPEELFDEYLKDTVYKDKQVDDEGVHLTVNEIRSLSTTGEIDFGGGEFKEACVDKIEPVKRSDDDKYGWWSLSKGTYMVEFNEKVAKDISDVSFASNGRLFKCGGSLSNMNVDNGKIQALLYVPELGVEIKENARIAVIKV